VNLYFVHFVGYCVSKLIKILRACLAVQTSNLVHLLLLFCRLGNKLFFSFGFLSKIIIIAGASAAMAVVQAACGVIPSGYFQEEKKRKWFVNFSTPKLPVEQPIKIFMTS